MTSQKSKKDDKSLPDQYLRQIDTRTEVEKILSGKIADNLSYMNIKRIQETNMGEKEKQIEGNFHFICLSGLPPIQGEFDKLDLPGTVTVSVLSGYEKQYSEKDMIQIFKKQSWDNEALKLRKIVEGIDKKKKIILIYHSFGSFTICVYLKIFKEKHDLSGIIDIGGAPITFYPIIKKFMAMCYHLDDDFLLENVDFIQSQYLKDNKNSPFLIIQNKYLTISFMKLLKDHHFKDMFENLRNHPKFLKLIIYGSNDSIFMEELLDEKFIHYSYINTPSQEWEQKGKQFFKQLYGKETTDIQSRFCMKIAGGKHSIHIQPKIIPILKKAIRQYVWMVLKCAN